MAMLFYGCALPRTLFCASPPFVRLSAKEKALVAYLCGHAPSYWMRHPRDCDNDKIHNCYRHPCVTSYGYVSTEEKKRRREEERNDKVLMENVFPEKKKKNRKSGVGLYSTFCLPVDNAVPEQDT